MTSSLVRPLRLREQMSLGAHLLMCSGCTNFRKQMTTLREVTQAYAEGRAVMAEPGETDTDPPQVRS